VLMKQNGGVNAVAVLDSIRPEGAAEIGYDEKEKERNVIYQIAHSKGIVHQSIRYERGVILLKESPAMTIVIQTGKGRNVVEKGRLITILMTNVEVEQPSPIDNEK
ncbi:MAG: hypothetical protein KDC02_23715, partial [Flavobacteriales bacterium]|nr:hypothetical protein [Flavobacteriales bacterium]